MRATRIFRVIAALLVFAAALLVLYVTQPMVPRHVPPPGAANAGRLRTHVRQLCGLLPRNLGDPLKLEAAAAYIRSEWEREGVAVREQQYDADGARVTNLLARFGPEGGALLVIGAHYDAAGRNPGADDNASGVAGLLELGRLLAKHPPAGAVELVAYALEEPPWFGGPQMGSAVHAHQLRIDTAHVRGMIALEMIGSFSDARGSQGYPSALMKLFYPTRGTFVAVAGRPADVGLVRRVKRAMADATDLPVRSITAPPALGQHDLSDNRSYWNERYRAVMVTDTAFFRNRAYHTPDDGPETLDYERMAKVVTGVFAAARSLAGT